GLELGQLQLLPEPVDDLVDLELDDEADLAFAGAPLAPLRVAFLAPGLQDVAGLALALARALVHLRVGEAKPRMLQELYRHGDRAVARPGHEVGIRQELGQALLHRIAHLLVVAQPVSRAPREEIVPGRLGGDADRHVIPGRAAW